MNHMRTGLTSVTFRKKSVDEIIAMAKKAGLTGIEWGGDVHVPAGDVETAALTARKTREAGLEVLSYGSYFRGDEGEDFAPVLASAKALGAPVIRVWAGRKTFEESSPEEIDALAARFREAAEAAKEEGIALAFEYHRNTATQTISGALSMLKAVRDGNMFCYWQPNPDISHEEQLGEIDAILPFLQNIHVFCWTGKNERHLLVEGISRWTDYLNHIREGGKNHDLILEFVLDDSDDAFYQDARTLQNLLADLGL
ncbi:MAG: sugar phosphate isomerase/epimerase family protein [Candidatus Merdivicinus sp.]